MLTIRILITGLLFLVGPMCGSVAHAQDRIDVVEGMHICGGVGQEDRNAMIAQRPKYNLRLTFAQAGTGEFITGVNVAIEAKGKVESTVEPFTDCGPMLFVKLKPGMYRITATYDGKSMSSLLRVKAAGTDKVFYWAAT